MNAAINNMTIAQLKQELTSKGIKFAPKMKKDDLVNLLVKENEEQKPEEVEFPEAKPMEDMPVEEATEAAAEEEDLMEKAKKVIHEVVSAWGDLETLTRNIILNELRDIGEQFVADNRRQLMKLAVEAIQNEAEKRANNETPVEEPAEPVVEEKQPEEVVAEEKVGNRCQKCGKKCLGLECLAHDPERMDYRNLNLSKNNEEEVVAEEPVAQEEPVVEEKPKKKRAPRMKKAKQAEPVEEPAAEEAVVEEAASQEEPAEPVVEEKPKKKRAPKEKKPEEDIRKINAEELTLIQIREYLQQNGMEKQLKQLGTIIAAINKPKKEKKEKKERAPNHFNLYMKDEMASLKEQFPEMNHKERFTQAVANWKTSEKNPKNQ
jgi:hypothetical protein